MTSYWHLYVQLNEPVIEPLGEAVPNTELFRRLARAMGFTEDCFRDSDEDLIRQALSGGSPYLEGITLERLKRERFIKVSRPAAPFADGGFGTPSGKVEFYSQALADAGLDPVVEYTPPAESIDGSPELAARYPIALITPAAHHFLNSTFANLPRMREREGGAPIFLNPVDAEARNIRTGDWVRALQRPGLGAAAGPGRGLVAARRRHLALHLVVQGHAGRRRHQRADPGPAGRHGRRRLLPHQPGGGGAGRTPPDDAPR